MENASKALIIAGSILLSILIIALGMFIFNNSSSTSDGMTTTLSENEKQTFNVKFDKYVGDQTGSSVAALVGALRANANTNRSSGEKIPLVIFFDNGAVIPTTPNTAAAGDNIFRAALPAGATDLSDGTNLGNYIDALGDMTNAIEKSHRYEISVDYNTEGLVDEIIITY